MSGGEHANEHALATVNRHPERHNAYCRSAHRARIERSAVGLLESIIDDGAQGIS